MMFVLFILVCISTFGMIGRAQNDFLNQFEGMLSGRNGLSHLPPGFGLFSSDLAKDLVDENSMNRVVTALQGHIKQWSFIEAQLLEPNVNLGMPEIVIPLKHLTTAYELLANIFYIQDKIASAKDCLENVCPLIELLPGNGQDKKYPEEGCYSLLREVYRELMDRKRDLGVSKNGLRAIRRIGVGQKKSLESSRDDEDMDLKDSPRYLPADFDIEARIEELRAPYDHLRVESRQLSHLQYFDSPLLTRSDVPILVFEDGQIQGDTINIGDLEFEEIYSDGNSFNKIIGLKFNDEMQFLVRRFIFENEIGRVQVLADTRKLIDNIRNKLINEGVEMSKISYRLRIGDVVCDVMEQAIKQGLSFITDEMFNAGMLSAADLDAAMHDYSTLFSNSWLSSGDGNVPDHIRHFVLEAFDEVLEAGEIGIGSGHEPGYRTKTSNRENNSQKKSRREKRKQLEIPPNTPEAPQTTGILKQGPISQSNDRFTISNLVVLLLLLFILSSLYIFYYDFQRRYAILNSKTSSHRRPSNSHSSSLSTSNSKKPLRPLTVEVFLSYFQSNPVFEVLNSDSVSSSTTTSTANGKAKRPGSEKSKNKSQMSPNAKSTNLNADIAITHASVSSKQQTSWSSIADIFGVLLSLLGVMLSVLGTIIGSQSSTAKSNTTVTADTTRTKDSNNQEFSNNSSHVPVVTAPQSPQRTPERLNASLVSPVKNKRNLDSDNDSVDSDNNDDAPDLDLPLANNKFLISHSNQSESKKLPSPNKVKPASVSDTTTEEDVLSIIAEVEAAAAAVDDGGWIVATRSNHTNSSSKKHEKKETNQKLNPVSIHSNSNHTNPLNHAKNLPPRGPWVQKKDQQNHTPSNHKPVLSKPVHQKSKSHPPSQYHSPTLTASSTLSNEAFPLISTASSSAPSPGERSRVSSSPTLLLDQLNSDMSSSYNMNHINERLEQLSSFPAINVSRSNDSYMFDNRSVLQGNAMLGSQPPVLPNSFDELTYQYMNYDLYSRPPPQPAFDPYALANPYPNIVEDRTLGNLNANTFDTNTQLFGNVAYPSTLSPIDDINSDPWNYDQLFASPQQTQSTQQLNTSPVFSTPSQLDKYTSPIGYSDLYSNNTSVSSYDKPRAQTNLDSFGLQDITIQTPVFSLSADAPSFTPASMYSKTPTSVDTPQSSEKDYLYDAFSKVSSTLDQSTDMSLGKVRDSKSNGLDKREYSSRFNRQLLDPVESVESKPQQHTVVLLCYCSFLPTGSVKGIKILVYSTLGTGGTSSILTMKRLKTNPGVWRAVAVLPWSAELMTYKYIVESSEKVFYEESRSDPRSVDFRSPKYTTSDGVPLSEIYFDDVLENGVVINGTKAK